MMIYAVDDDSKTKRHESDLRERIASHILWSSSPQELLEIAASIGMEATESSTQSDERTQTCGDPS